MFIDLFVDSEGRGSRITVGASSLQRKTSSSYSSPSLSNYTRTSRCEDLFAFYSTPNDCINNYF